MPTFATCMVEHAFAGSDGRRRTHHPEHGPAARAEHSVLERVRPVVKYKHKALLLDRQCDHRLGQPRSRE